MQFYEVNSERNCREFWVSWRFFSGVKMVLRRYDKNKRNPDSIVLPNYCCSVVWHRGYHQNKNYVRMIKFEV